MLKTLNTGVLWLTGLWQVAWCSGSQRTIGNWRYLHHTQKVKQEAMQQLLRHFSILHLPGEVYARALKKDAAKHLIKAGEYPERFSYWM